MNFNNAIILLYHGVASERSKGVKNFSGKHIFVDDFEAQMKHLNEKCNAISLREMAGLMLSKKSFPKKTVAVTFDDSARNVFDNGFGILKKYKIPATLFITTGFVGSDRMYWSDIIENIIDDYGDDVLKLNTNGYSRSFSMRNTDDKIKAIIELKKHLKNTKDSEKESIISELARVCKSSLTDIQNKFYMNLSWDDIRKMDNDPLIDIGGHTATHKILSMIPLEEAKNEIISSKNKLEQELSHKIDLFSYPEGQANHYNNDIINILKEVGFICSPSAIDGDNPPGSDPFHLKRVMVGFMGTPFPFN